MSCVSVIRVGGSIGSETAIEILSKELQSHFPIEQPTATASDENDKGADTDTDTMLQISNKYFTANVQLKVNNDDPTAAATADDDTTNERETKIANEKEDGIILIFPSKSSSTETLTSIHNQITSTIQDCGDNLRLCISTNYDSTSGASNLAETNPKAYEEQYSQRVLWCLDRGYEYIEIHDLSKQGLSSGFDDREKDGFARVVEAVGGTLWSSAVMGSKKTNVSTGGTVGNQVGDKARTTNTTPTTTDSGVDEQTSTKMDKNLGISSSSTTAPPKSLHEELLFDPETSRKNTDGGSTNDDDNKKEALLDDIEHVMKEAKRIRDDSKQNHNTMSDEDRRRRAGDAATMLLGLLDQMGFEDDDSSDEE